MAVRHFEFGGQFPITQPVMFTQRAKFFPDSFHGIIREEVTADQTLGHIVQNMAQMQKSMEEMQKEIERLMAFVGMETEVKPKKKEKRRDEDDAGVNE